MKKTILEALQSEYSRAIMQFNNGINNYTTLSKAIATISSIGLDFELYFPQLFQLKELGCEFKWK